MIVGYARVSTVDQNLDRQLKELEKFGCEKIFSEKISGKNFERPKYQEMKKFLRMGDTLVVHTLSRLGRNSQMILDEWKYLMDKEVDIVVLDMPILDTRKYKELEGVGKLVTDIVLNLLSWMVESERVNTKRAQREGIEIAKEKGKYKGRKKKYHKNATGKDKLVYDTVIQMITNKESVMDIHRRTGLTRKTIYNIKKEYEREQDTKLHI